MILAQEPDAQGRLRWVMTLGGYGADLAEPSAAGMRRRAREIGVPEMVALAEHGRAIGPVQRYCFPHSRHRRFFPAAARVVDAPWQLAVGNDLALPGVEGRRPPGAAYRVRSGPLPVRSRRACSRSPPPASSSPPCWHG